MNDLLFSLGPLTVHQLGAYLAVSYLVGIFYFWRLGRREGFASDSLLDLIFLTSLVGLLGGRLAFLAFSGGAWGLGELFQVGEGIFWAGTLLGGILAVLLFAKAQGWSPLRLLALAAVGASFGQALGFLGAEVANYLPFAFYPALGYLFVWIILRFLLFRVTEPGYLSALYLVFSGGLLILAEWLRGSNAVWGSWNINYLSGAVFSGIGLLLFVFLVAKTYLIKVKR